MRQRRSLAAYTSLLLLVPSLLTAQEQTSGNAGGGVGGGTPAPAQGSSRRADPRGGGASGHPVGAPRATAARIRGGMRIDGRLDDLPWSEADPVTLFTQTDPDEGARASHPTEVRIAYDDEALYLGGRMSDSGPITAKLARRDASVNNTDYLIVSIDTYHDHQTAFRFAVSPSGLRRDMILKGEQESGDNSWDPVWEVATAIDDEGWSAEMRIPFSQLRFVPSETQEWGLQLERRIDRLQERALFAFTPKLELGGVARYGHLDGIRGVRPGRRLEMLPFLVARGDFLQIDRPAGVGFDDPYRSDSDYALQAGLDLKYRISSNLTLSATVNPDFGQVEVDPAVLNLTAFETRFEERRPFFVEGADIFSFGEGGPRGSTGTVPEVFYSRRVGRAPRGSLPSGAVYDDAPESTTILGAAKLTGRFGDGWALGLLEAVTPRESASWIDGNGARGETALEPTSNYLAARIRRDFRGGHSRVGALATAVHRDLMDPQLTTLLHSSAIAGGVDFLHEFGDREWRVSGMFVGSHVQGDPAALARTQGSSVRYLGRPDARHVELDPTLRSLSGYSAMLDFRRQTGAFTGLISVAPMSPGYEVNDFGFQTRADRIILDTSTQYRITTPGRIFRSWWFGGGPDNIWSYGGDHVFSQVNITGAFQFLNYWNLRWRFEFEPSLDDDRLTRGGPLARIPARNGGELTLDTDGRKPLVTSLTYRWSRDDADTWQRSGALTLTYRPRDNWEIQVGPELIRSDQHAQYVTSVADPTATATFGRRYLFAGLDQTTLSFETRMNVTFTPRLSLELYAQPFLSTGEYGTLMEFATPGGYDFLRYGVDVGTSARDPDGTWRIDPDGSGASSGFAVRDPTFDYRSLLGNAVLRWEWRPGSTLFFVWQQSRAHRIVGLDAQDPDSDIGRFNLRQDAERLFGIAPDNIFMVKLNYWLNP